jgi:hypothetical protein
VGSGKLSMAKMKVSSRARKAKGKRGKRRWDTVLVGRARAALEIKQV